MQTNDLFRGFKECTALKKLAVQCDQGAVTSSDDVCVVDVRPVMPQPNKDLEGTVHAVDA